MTETNSGGYCGGVPPLPIPNREVKPACADGTAMQCGRVGGCLLIRVFGATMLRRPFFVPPRPVSPPCVCRALPRVFVFSVFPCRFLDTACAVQYLCIRITVRAFFGLFTLYLFERVISGCCALYRILISFINVFYWWKTLYYICISWDFTYLCKKYA